MSELEPITREEEFLNAIATGQSADLIPQTRQEMFLNAIATGGSAELTPLNGTITWAKIEGSIYENQYVDGTTIS